MLIDTMMYILFRLSCHMKFIQDKNDKTSKTNQNYFKTNKNRITVEGPIYSISNIAKKPVLYLPPLLV